MMSALLARAGLTGPPTILEGRRGVVRMFGRVEDPSFIVDGLEDTSWFAVQGRTMKIYPTVGTVPTSIQALASLVDEHQFRPEDVARVDVWLQPNALVHGAAIREPTDTIGAQFSLAFSLGLRLVTGRNDLRDYLDPARLADPRIRAIGELLHVYGDPRRCARSCPRAAATSCWSACGTGRAAATEHTVAADARTRTGRHRSLTQPPG